MKQFCMLLFYISLLSLTGGCMVKEKELPRIDRKFMICTQEQIPKEIQKIIEEKQEKAFRFTYCLQESMYIVVGYGEQTGGGYSIQVRECSEENKNIYIDTNLLGSDSVKRENEKSYPYIVIKTDKSEKNVIFL